MTGLTVLLLLGGGGLHFGREWRWLCAHAWHVYCGALPYMPSDNTMGAGAYARWTVVVQHVQHACMCVATLCHICCNLPCVTFGGIALFLVVLSQVDGVPGFEGKAYKPWYILYKLCQGARPQFHCLVSFWMRRAALREVAGSTVNSDA